MINPISVYQQRTSNYPLEIDEEDFSENNLFPCEPSQPNEIKPLISPLLPIEIIRNIYSEYISNKDLVTMMLLNISWHYLIGNDLEIYGKKIYIPRCIFFAKQTAEEMICIVKKGIVKEHTINLFESKYQLTMLKQHTYKYETWKSLVQDVKQIALSNRTQANDKAQRIEDLLIRTQALIEIAKINPLHDFTEAYQAALEIKNIEKRSKALFKIVSAEVHFNMSAAAQTANEIQGPFFKAKAYIKIANLDPMHDLTNAKAIAVSITTFHRDIIFIKILEVESCFNFKNAIDTLCSLSFVEKDKGYKILVSTLAKINLEEAKEWVKKFFLHEDVQSSKAYLEIVKIEVQTDFERAKITAGYIFHAKYKVEALLEIANVDPAHSVDFAIITAKSIEMEFYRSIAFQNIAIFQAKYDVNGALEIIEHITMAGMKDSTLRRIAIIVSEYSLSKAFEITNSIYDLKIKSETFIAIGKSVLIRKYS